MENNFFVSLFLYLLKVSYIRLLHRSKIMLNLRNKLCLFFLCLLSMSCIKEDFSRCESGLSLKFKYELNTKYWELGRPVDLFHESIGYLSVLLFDSEGKYFDEYKGEDVFGSKAYKLQMRLPEGKYTALVWGGGDADLDYNFCHLINVDKNIYEKKLTKGVTRLQDFRMIINHRNIYDGDYVVLDAPDDLYYGKVDNIVVGTDPNQVSEYTVDMMRNTHKVRVIVKRVGWEESLSKEKPPYNVYCLARNARYNYDNTIGGDALPVKYIATPVVKDETHFEYDFNMLRLLKEGGDVKLVVSEANQSKSFVTVDIVKSILANPKYNSQQDLDREELYEFEVNVHQNMSVEVFINGWKSYDIDIEI